MAGKILVSRLSLFKEEDDPEFWCWCGMLECVAYACYLWPQYARLLY
jgi:hypothetical protein